MQTYVQRTVDGMKEDVQLLGERVEQQPVPETILIGSPAPVSPFDFDLEVDENGKPLHYSRLLRDQVATGYSARSGAKTASGRYAITGHVAVDPRVIPYARACILRRRTAGLFMGAQLPPTQGRACSPVWSMLICSMTRMRKAP